MLPNIQDVRVLPLSVTAFAEPGDFTLLPNGLVRIDETGLYRVRVCLDGKARGDGDIDLRDLGIGRVRLGGQAFDRLAVVDMPAAGSPTHVRETSSVLLYAGEQVFGIGRPDAPGGDIRATRQPWLQVERRKGT